MVTLSCFDKFRSWYISEKVYAIDHGKTLKKFIDDGLSIEMICLYGLEYWDLLTCFNIATPNITSYQDKSGMNFLHHLELYFEYHGEEDAMFFIKNIRPAHYTIMLRQKNKSGKVPKLPNTVHELYCSLQ